jgi:hypothetical protein
MGEAAFSTPYALGGIVQFAVEVALGLEEGGVDVAIWQPDPNGALWDTQGLWSGLVPTWVDVTTRAIEAGTKRGRDRWEQEYRVGSSIVTLDNQDGVFNPDTPSPGALTMRPGRWLRVLGRRTDDGSAWVPLWTGQVDTLEDRYTSAGRGINSRFSGLDFGSRFQIDDPPALDTPLPAGQLTSVRVDYILDEANWPSEPGYRSIELGLHTMQESDQAQSRWRELQAAATAEGGYLFIGPDGAVVFRNRDWLSGKLGGPLEYQFGQVGSDVQILAADTDWSQQRIWNDIRMARVGGTEYRVEDLDSIALYGRRTFRRFDLQCQTDSQVQALADRFLGAFRFDRSRLESVDLVPTSPAGVSQLLAIDVGAYIRVTVRTGGDGDWSYTGDYFVQAVEHRIDADDWVVSLRIDSADFTVPLLPAAFTDGFDEGFDSQDAQ